VLSPKEQKYVHHSAPSTDRGIKTVRQLEQVFHSYGVMELEQENKAVPITTFLQRK
jgi:hypothetical protein